MPSPEKRGYRNVAPEWDSLSGEPEMLAASTYGSPTKGRFRNGFRPQATDAFITGFDRGKQDEVW
jgi:hypothetical protein